jgi:hypothetical protein
MTALGKLRRLRTMINAAARPMSEAKARRAAVEIEGYPSIRAAAKAAGSLIRSCANRRSRHNLAVCRPNRLGLCLHPLQQRLMGYIRGRRHLSRSA